MRNHNEACRKRIEELIAEDDEAREQKRQADARLEDQLIRALEREDELLQRQDAARQEVAAEGKPASTFSAGSGLVVPDDEMTSAENLQSPPRVAHDARAMSPGDF